MKTDRGFLRLDDRVAIVTGAATGLGAATAKTFSEHGARVVINHLPGQEELAAEAARACEGEALCLAGDVTSFEDCKRTAATAFDRWGRLDILVNNAGVNKPAPHYDLDALNPEDFLNIYNVNVVGAAQMIRASVPLMKEGGGGVVVNVSSAAAYSGAGSSIPYGASKAAMNVMTMGLARALAPEIRMNAVCPSYMPTPIMDKIGWTQEEQERIHDTIREYSPLGVLADGELVSRAILFFASDLSAHLTGQTMASDGGVMLGKYASIYDRDEKDA